MRETIEPEVKMPSDPIHDRGCGPEIIGTRITVYNLLPYFLDPTATEAYICRLYELTAEQVAAARAYIFNNLEMVLAQHLKIEARIAAGNPPEVIQQAKKTHEALLSFKEWLVQRQQAEAQEEAAEAASGSSKNGFPTFREWLAEEEVRHDKVS